MEYLLAVFQALFALALAPLVMGFVRWLKARMQNRRRRASMAALL